MRIKSYIPVAALGLLALTTSCQNDMETFDNSIFAPTLTTATTINVKPTTEVASGKVKASMASLEHRDITVTFSAAADKVAEYNALYNTDYVMLPQEFYSIPEPTAVIPAGGDSTEEVPVNFQNLTSLDMSKTYLLPVQMSSEFASLSNNTYWFIIKEASLVSVVADMTRNYAVFAQGNQAPQLENLTQITVEALLYPLDFPNMLATVMGIEGNFLVRIGDAGIPGNQLQLATANGNLTDASWTFDTNTWTFMTLTYDTATGECNVYFNGVQKGATQTGGYHSPINWNTASGDITDGPRGFYVGYAYDANRYFNGYMSELRIWNRILSKDEINAPYHFYSVEPDSEGLVSYWKMDEGAGKSITDYANGYNLICNEAPEWIPESLPVK